MSFPLKRLVAIFVFLAGTLFAAENPQRIVSLTPCATDILSEIGVSRELVGVTRYCKAPAGSSPRIIGGLVDPSAETILALKPDLLVHADVRDKTFLERMSKNGIRYITLFPESYENIKRDICLLGKQTGRQAQANALLKEWENAEAAIREDLKKNPLPYRPRVLILWGEVCAGENSYLNDAIELCGGINAAPAGTSRNWPLLTKEALVATRAEVLIYISADGENRFVPAPELADKLKKNPAFSLLPAIRKKKIFRLNENSRLLYPSPLLRHALPQLAEAIRKSARPGRR